MATSEKKLSEVLAEQSKDAVVRGSAAELAATARDEQLSSAEEQDAERQAQEQGLTKDTRVVRWYGQRGVDYREISVEDWRQAGLDTEQVEAKTVRWDDSNDRTVPLSFLESFLTEQQIQAWIVRDSRLKIEDK